MGAPSRTLFVCSASLFLTSASRIPPHCGLAAPPGLVLMRLLALLVLSVQVLQVLDPLTAQHV
ncbi:hypothetical protein HPP92_017917 [Vanilla planifolia]|uniref:Uncharacterized protein n=1 Tax=Vanilla planifolia TaxID=51239 RepID=A0A835QA58_VANPL|nr:hypothetical protein HPP92_017917 [Vanilla planifolia]